MERARKRTRQARLEGHSTGSAVQEILLIEDNAARAERRQHEGRGDNRRGMPVVVRLHRIVGETPEIAAEAAYKSGSLRRQGAGRASIAFDLLDEVPPSSKGSLLIAGAAYGSNRAFLRGVFERQLEATVELRPTMRVERVCAEGQRERAFQTGPVSDLLGSAAWKVLDVWLPQLDRVVKCRAAELGLFRVEKEHRARLFAFDVGAIEGVHPGTVIGATTDERAEVAELIRALYWVQWIRPFVRRQERSCLKPPSPANGDGANCSYGLTLRYRSNITLARLQDEASTELKSL